MRSPKSKNTFYLSNRRKILKDTHSLRVNILRRSERYPVRFAFSAISRPFVLVFFGAGLHMAIDHDDNPTKLIKEMRSLGHEQEQGMSVIDSFGKTDQQKNANTLNVEHAKKWLRFSEKNYTVLY